jgi:hypothetical protein
MALTKRGGRKLMIAPAGVASLTPPRARIDSTIIKALARAFRWKAMLEGGQFASISELAKAEKINQSYLCRVIRLTLLPPDIVEAILDGRQPRALQLHQLLKPGPVLWEIQRETLCVTALIKSDCQHPNQP